MPSVTVHLVLLRQGLSLNWALIFSQLGWKLANPSKGITLHIDTCVESWAYYVVLASKLPSS